MSQHHVTGVRCLSCGEQLRRVALVCPSWQGLGSFETTYDLEEVGRTMDRESLDRREPWMWRFKELLPLDELAEQPPLQIGLTPVFGAPRLAAWLGVNGLWIKDEGRNPTGGVEDRFAAVAVVEAREAGRGRLVRACRGADGLALACVASSCELEAVLVTGAAHDADALARAALFGARVVTVDGSFEQALALSHQLAGGSPLFDANPDHPALADGLKTLGLEIAEQLCERMPDWVAMSADDGFALAAVARGIREMQELGIVRSLPRLLAVESESGALRAERRVGEEQSFSLRRAAMALKETRGAAVAASAPQIEEAHRALAREGAVLAGRAGALAAAGVREAVRSGIVSATETVLLVSDGGPVAIAPAGAQAPAPIPATLEALKAAVG